MDADENLMMAGKLFFSLLRSLIVRTRVLEKTIRMCICEKYPASLQMQIGERGENMKGKWPLPRYFEEKGPF